MSSRRARIVVRALDEDPEKKHRGVRQVRLWVWVALLLALPLFAYLWLAGRGDASAASSAVHARTAEPAAAGQAGSAEMWAAGEEATLELSAATAAAPLPRWSVCAVPAPGADAELRQRQGNAVASWLAAGAAQVALLSLRGGAGTAGAARAARAAEGSGARVERFAELEGEDGVPWLSSAVRGCERLAAAELVVLLHADALLLPSFGPRLLLLAARLSSAAGPFLLAGPRLTVRATAAQARQTLERGEPAARREWARGSRRSRAAAVDLLAWRRGSWRDAAIPNLLLGSSGWEAWLWAHARQAQWAAVDGGNVLFGLHPWHPRSAGPALFQRNAERVREWLRLSGGTACDTPQCAGYLLYAGRCRGVGERDERRDDRFCLRKKEEAWSPGGAEDHKAVLAERF